MSAVKIMLLNFSYTIKTSEKEKIIKFLADNTLNDAEFVSQNFVIN